MFDWQRIFDPTALAQAVVGTAIVAALGFFGSRIVPRIWKHTRIGVGGFMAKEVRKHLFIVDRYRAADGQTRLEFQNYIAMRIRRRQFSSLSDLPFFLFGFAGLSIVHGERLYIFLFSASVLFGAILLVINSWKLTQLEMLEDELFASVQPILSVETFEDAERQRLAANPSETPS
jgi:hypothetical protein